MESCWSSQDCCCCDVAVVVADAAVCVEGVDTDAVVLGQVVGSSLGVADAAESWVLLVSMTSQVMKLNKKNELFKYQSVNAFCNVSYAVYFAVLDGFVYL